MRKVLTIICAAIATGMVFTGCGKSIEVELVYPEDGAVVSSIVTLYAEVFNTVATRTEFYIDDSLHCTVLIEPYECLWSTYDLDDNSVHEIYVIAYDRDVTIDTSPVVQVTVMNGSVRFADDFEMYLPFGYPYPTWYNIWHGMDTAYVTDYVAHSGNQSFRLGGSSQYPRVDAVDLVLDDVNLLTYEYSVMVSDSTTGTQTGFFVFISPDLGAVVNGVQFNFEDGYIHVRGVYDYNTGQPWFQDTWYNVRVEVDYDSLFMAVWFDDSLIVSGLHAASRDTSSIFMLATQFAGGGIAYYDDIYIMSGENFDASRPVVIDERQGIR
ncbi:MAG: hypothetical protein JSW02_06725 [candidate division WOR-3 bacterium]|nr:MAG: hypothetical protein JSW02_06725 [candidate division WOR-3 bacterium]